MALIAAGLRILKFSPPIKAANITRSYLEETHSSSSLICCEDLYPHANVFIVDSTEEFESDEDIFVSVIILAGGFSLFSWNPHAMRPMQRKLADFLSSKASRREKTVVFLPEYYYHDDKFKILQKQTRTIDGIHRNGGKMWEEMRHFLDEALPEVLSEVAPGKSVNRITLDLFGYSLGGVYLRYAIGEAEKQGYWDNNEHIRLRTYVSLASPHLGTPYLGRANMPNFLRHYLRYTGGPLSWRHHRTSLVSQIVYKDKHKIFVEIAKPDGPYVQALLRFDKRVLYCLFDDPVCAVLTSTFLHVLHPDEFDLLPEPDYTQCAPASSSGRKQGGARAKKRAGHKRTTRYRRDGKSRSKSRRTRPIGESGDVDGSKDAPSTTPSPAAAASSSRGRNGHRHRKKGDGVPSKDGRDREGRSTTKHSRDGDGDDRAGSMMRSATPRKGVCTCAGFDDNGECQSDLSIDGASSGRMGRRDGSSDDCNGGQEVQRKRARGGKKGARRGRRGRSHSAKQASNDKNTVSRIDDGERAPSSHPSRKLGSSGKALEQSERASLVRTRSYRPARNHWEEGETSAARLAKEHFLELGQKQARPRSRSRGRRILSPRKHHRGESSTTRDAHTTEQTSEVSMSSLTRSGLRALAGKSPKAGSPQYRPGDITKKALRESKNLAVETKGRLSLARRSSSHPSNISVSNRQDAANTLIVPSDGATMTRRSASFDRGDARRPVASGNGSQRSASVDGGGGQRDDGHHHDGAEGHDDRASSDDGGLGDGNVSPNFGDEGSSSSSSILAGSDTSASSEVDESNVDGKGAGKTGKKRRNRRVECEGGDKVVDGTAMASKQCGRKGKERDVGGTVEKDGGDDGGGDDDVGASMTSDGKQKARLKQRRKRDKGKVRGKDKTGGDGKGREDRKKYGRNVDGKKAVALDGYRHASDIPSSDDEHFRYDAKASRSGDSGRARIGSRRSKKKGHKRSTGKAKGQKKEEQHQQHIPSSVVFRIVYDREKCAHIHFDSKSNRGKVKKDRAAPVEQAYTYLNEAVPVERFAADIGKTVEECEAESSHHCVFKNDELLQHICHQIYDI